MTAWAWFAAWAVVGVGVGLALSVVGVITVPAAVVLGSFLWRRSGARGSLVGVVSGVGLVPLYVAARNRGGPGRTCSRTATSVTCSDLLSPWPWLAAGLLLVGAGVTAQIVRRRR